MGETNRRKVGFYIFSCVCVCCCVGLFVTPQTVAHQASLSMGFSRQEHWSGLPFLSPGDLPDPGIKLASLTSHALAGGSFTTSIPQESLWYFVVVVVVFNKCLFLSLLAVSLDVRCLLGPVCKREQTKQYQLHHLWNQQIFDWSGTGTGAAAPPWNKHLESGGWHELLLVFNWRRLSHRIRALGGGKWSGRV